jgi:hypothetical protein
MESLDETTKKISTKIGFFKHVFNFEEDSKSEMINIIQYSLLSIIPVVILNKLSQKYVPEADEEKGSFEILAEIIIQVLVIFLGILLIHRIITYIPTYSGIKYPDFSVITIVLAVLLITLSLQTKLGEKVSILSDRIGELWNGTSSSDDKDKKKKQSSGGGGQVRISQPISGQQQQQQQMPTLMTPNAAISQSLYTDSTPINQLPVQQQSNNNESFVGGMQESFEPMAANAMGGTAFGNAFGGGF